MNNGSKLDVLSIAAPAWETRDNFTILMQGLSNLMSVLSALTKKVDLIMTSNQDVMDAITALTTGLTTLDTTVQSAISDMGTGGDAARAGFVTAIQAATTQVGTISTELTTAIAALTPPPAVPVVPPVGP